MIYIAGNIVARITNQAGYPSFYPLFKELRSFQYYIEHFSGQTGHGIVVAPRCALPPAARMETIEPLAKLPGGRGSPPSTDQKWPIFRRYGGSGSTPTVPDTSFASASILSSQLTARVPCPPQGKASALWVGCEIKPFFFGNWRACPPVEGPWPTLGQAGSTLAELGQAPTVWIQFFHSF
ncbi:MAG: hypothetical protein HYV36_04030 [Lentisphaerae bacterium]|nr:hypothetical protein [Lentisphaerota bacterium]